MRWTIPEWVQEVARYDARELDYSWNSNISYSLYSMPDWLSLSYRRRDELQSAYDSDVILRIEMEESLLRAWAESQGIINKQMNALDVLLLL